MSNWSRDARVPREWGFTLIEMLIVASIILILAGLLLPTLMRSKSSAFSASCMSNIKQLAMANIVYESTWRSYVAWGSDRYGANLHRWHGVRKAASNSSEYDTGKSPLVLEVKTVSELCCPIWGDSVDTSRASVERGGQGYGYNIHVGTRQYLVDDQNSSEAYSSGVRSQDVSSPDTTVMFADTAMLVSDVGDVDVHGELGGYSICAAPFGVNGKHTDLKIRNDPSIHFRHDALANVGWCDGHANPRHSDWTLDSDWRKNMLGFFGSSTDNDLFDLE